MAEMDIGLPGDGAAALGADSSAEVSAAAVKSFSYCGECGSWGAHSVRCVSCGYDFYAEPIDSSLD